MPKYLMLALNGPREGEGNEETLNQWYEDVHMPEFRRIEAVKSARRYKVFRGNLPGLEAWPYIAAYEIETDDIAAVSRQLATEVGPSHESMDRERSAHVWAVLTSGGD